MRKKSLQPLNEEQKRQMDTVGNSFMMLNILE